MRGRGVRALACGLGIALTGAAAGIGWAMDAPAVIGAPAVVGAASVAETETPVTLAALDSTVDKMWAGMPLTLRQAVIIDSFGGYGVFTPRPDNRFKTGDTLQVYLVPVGYGFAEDGGGFKSRIVADIEVTNKNGQVLARTENFTTLERLTRSKSRELCLTLSFALPALKPAGYGLRITLRDLVTGKSVATSLAFAVADPA